MSFLNRIPLNRSTGSVDLPRQKPENDRHPSNDVTRGVGSTARMGSASARSAAGGPTVSSHNLTPEGTIRRVTVEDFMPMDK